MALSIKAKLGTAALAALALNLVSRSPALAQEPPRTCWSYSVNDVTGKFLVERDRPRRWVELVSNGAVFRFTETRRCKDYIELYDASRDLSVRLHERISYVRWAATKGQFVTLYQGSWTEPAAPPAPAPGPEGPGVVPGVGPGPELPGILPPDSIIR
jgi:hypothetical protein